MSEEYIVMAEEQKNTSYEDALNKVESLYSSPMILAKTAKIINDSNVQLDDIVSFIKADAALTADIIKISNSAAYSFGEQVSNLSGAIKRIGFGKVTRIIGISAVNSMSDTGLTHYGLSQEEYWEDSISTALIMETLAVYCGVNPSDAYTIGLLHAIGKIVLNEIMEDYELDAVWDKSKDVEEWEKEVIGFTHTYASAMILKRWGFPSTTCHPILYQRKIPKEKIQWKLHSCIYISCKIVDIAGCGFVNSNPNFDEIIPILNSLGIEFESMPEIMERATEAFNEVKSSITSV